MFLRKQTHWPITWETQLDFHPDSPRVEAGTVAFWNYLCFASLGIRTNKDNDRIVRFTPPSGAGDIVEKGLATKGEVKFIVDSTEKSYRFGYRECSQSGDGEWTWLGEVDTQVLARNPEVGQPFTGMMLGLYAVGEMEPVLTPATFAYAEFK